MLSEDLRTHIIELKKKGFDHRVYSIMIQNYFCGKPIYHSGYEREAQVRLFNKRYANWNLRDYSDKLSFSDSVNPSMLPGTIHHYRCASLEEFYKKENRLAALQAKVLAASGNTIFPFTPALKACIEYLRCHITRLAWLDGKYGFTIAGRRCRTTYEAYRMARHIINENSDK